MSGDLGMFAVDIEELPDYNGWWFSYEFPGYFRFSRTDSPISVWATPDFEGEERINIQVEWTGDADYDENPPSDPVFPYAGRTAERYMALMRPILDHYQPIAADAKIDTRIDGEESHETTWREFVDANASGIDKTEIAEIASTLRRRGKYTGGGGAAPTFTLTVRSDR
jgi:hypothetical protein